MSVFAWGSTLGRPTSQAALKCSPAATYANTYFFCCFRVFAVTFCECCTFNHIAARPVVRPGQWCCCMQTARLCSLTLLSLVSLFPRLSLRTYSTSVALGTCHKHIAQHGQHISLVQGTSNNKLNSYFCMTLSHLHCVEGTCKPLGASAVCAQLAHCTPDSQARYSGNQTHQAILVWLPCCSGGKQSLTCMLCACWLSDCITQ